MSQRFIKTYRKRMEKRMINFNVPPFAGKELEYIRQAVESGKISGDGLFTKKCSDRKSVV